MIRRFGTPEQRRTSLAAAVLGNVVPILVLAQHHRPTDSGQLLVLLVGVTVAVVAPVAVHLVPPRLPWLLRAAAFGGLGGLTLMQADAGGQGGVDSPYAILLVMPMVWFGLMTTGVDLKAALGLVVACCFVPPLVLPDYYGRPADALGPALALSVVAVSVALSLAGLTRETKRLTDELRSAAVRDLLTGLLNRRGWDEVSRRALREVTPRTPVCVVLADLDNLKVVNDTLGHDVGDAVLRETGRRFHDEFGREAAVARLGGDDFAVLVIGSSAGPVLSRLHALRAATPERGAFSAGVALAVGGEDLHDTMRRADLALYEAKSTGRGRSRVSDRAVSLSEV